MCTSRYLEFPEGTNGFIVTLDLRMPTAGAYCQRGTVGPRPMVGLLYEVGISGCSLVLIYYLYINLDNIMDIVTK